VRQFKGFITLIIVLTFFVTACGGEEASSNEEEVPLEGEETINLRLGTLASEGSSLLVGAEGFAEEIHEMTDGRVNIDIYPGAQLGSEVSMTEQVQLGSLDMALLTSTTVANFIEDLYVLELPFLMEDRDHAYRVFDGEIGEHLSDKLSDNGFKNLGFWEVGFRNISNNQGEIRSPEDLENFSIRVGETQILIDTYNALGANPTPIAFPEVYTSLQQGVADGFEGAYQPFEDINLYEIQDYLSEVRISYHSNVFVMNKETFESLDPDIQEVFLELGEKHTHLQRELNQEIEEEQKKTTQEAGVEIVEYEDLDIDLFREAVEPVYEKYEEQFGDLISDIEEEK
jgi:tripartite ATP-independent transporter DctP family solute receptor